MLISFLILDYLLHDYDSCILCQFLCTIRNRILGFITNIEFFLMCLIYYVKKTCIHYFQFQKSKKNCLKNVYMYRYFLCWNQKYFKIHCAWFTLLIRVWWKFPSEQLMHILYCLVVYLQCFILYHSINVHYVLQKKGSLFLLKFKYMLKLSTLF